MHNTLFLFTRTGAAGGQLLSSSPNLGPKTFLLLYLTECLNLKSDD